VSRQILWGAGTSTVVRLRPVGKSTGMRAPNEISYLTFFVCFRALAANNDVRSTVVEVVSCGVPEPKR
jgi:hypothetical protein